MVYAYHFDPRTIGRLYGVLKMMLQQNSTCLSARFEFLAPEEQRAIVDFCNEVDDLAQRACDAANQTEEQRNEK